MTGGPGPPDFFRLEPRLFICWHVANYINTQSAMLPCVTLLLTLGSLLHVYESINRTVANYFDDFPGHYIMPISRLGPNSHLIFYSLKAVVKRNCVQSS